MNLSAHLAPIARPWSLDEMAAALRFAWTHGGGWMVALAFPPNVTPEQVGQLDLLKEQTGCRLHLRCYEHAPILRYDPVAWGERCADILRPYLHLVDLATTSNEDNLPEEGGVTDPARLADWYLSSAYRLRQLLGGACPPLAVPPLSPAVAGYRETHEAMAGALSHAFDAVACHVYAREGNYSDVAWLESLYGLPVHVKEFDTHTDAGYVSLSAALAAMPAAQSVAWFALDGDDPAFKDFYFVPNEAAILGGGLDIMPPRDEEFANRIALLEQQQGLTLDLIQRVLEGRWDAATFGAEAADALLQSFNPKYAGVRAVKFPNP